MREIKFRGVAKNGDEVIYSKSIDQDAVGVRMRHGGLWRYVNPETVEQFTGHQDVNGKDVYCGDRLTTCRGDQLYIKETSNGWMPFLGTRTSSWLIVQKATIIK